MRNGPFSSLSGRVHLCLVSAVLAATTVLSSDALAEDTEELARGLAEGYLARDELPNSLALLPPPPVEGSAAMAADEARSAASLALQDTERFDLARSDADLTFPAAAGIFACALGFAISEERTPRLYLLLRRSLTDAGLATYAAKNHYQRPRPFMANKAATCTPAYEEALRGNGSYPSGHTAIGWAWALILTEIAPSRTDAILARGLAYGDSRIVCNVHWGTDVSAGRVIGAATVARLRADPEFLSDLDAAKDEVRTAMAGGSPPSRDCSAEAAALSDSR